jgi:kynureninase
MIDFQSQFKTFLKANQGTLHFAAHSHHYWPDACIEVHGESLKLAIEQSDRKWETIFGEWLPETRGLIAETLGLSDPTRIAFAPNTHELFYRVVSCLPNFHNAKAKPNRILTSSGEFHSIERQLRVWEEHGVLTHLRGSVLRMGIGVYLDPEFELPSP